MSTHRHRFLAVAVVALAGVWILGTLGEIQAAKTPLYVESAETPEVQRANPISHEAPKLLMPQSIQELQPQSIEAVEAESLGPNLISNPSVETAGSTGLPTGWLKGGYGTNSRTLTYPVPGFESAKGLQVSISSYTSGDAKWYFQDVAVTPGKTYEFSDYYFADVPSFLTAQYKMSNGSFAYVNIAALPAASVYTKAAARFTVPANAVSVTVFHLIKQVGSLTTDVFSLNLVNEATPQPTNNLVANPGFESGTSGQPTSWGKGRWGTNTAVFTYPVSGVGGSRAASVAITSYTSGDAKWYFTPVAVSQGMYTYSDQYKATIGSRITAQFGRSDGTLSYVDLASPPPADAFTPVSVSFSVPAGVVKVTIFHLIKGVGELTIDTVSLVRASASEKGVFETGAISLAFDDGWLSQYQNAAPKLNQAGLKATFFLVSQRWNEEGFPGFMSRAQARELRNQGHEIGAHTRTHRHLTSLSESEQREEILGSMQDLEALGLGPVVSFAYPFGDYNETTLEIVHAGEYEGARTSMPGNISISTDKYQLPRFSVEVNTTFEQVKQAIDAAIGQKEWLVLVFHQINNSTERYTTAPETLNKIVDYLAAQRIRVVTIGEGLGAWR